MEPRQTGSGKGFELPPVQAAGYSESAPEIGGLGGAQEVLPENRLEKSNTAPVETNHTPLAPPILPAIPTLDDATANSATAQDDGAATIPLIANDDDLIEKEWVDKAKSIIAETKDDPYKREHEVRKLQIEYVRKRYGKEIGDTGE